MKSLLICSSIASLAAAAGVAFWVATWKHEDKDSDIKVALGNPVEPVSYFTRGPAVDCQVLAERPLWRDDRRPAPEKTADEDELEVDTPVDLELVAIAGSDDGKGFALIAQSAASSKDSRRRGPGEGEAPAPRSRNPGVLYAVGDEIPGTGMKVASISSDTVKLSGSKPQELKIEWASTAAKARLDVGFKEASSRKVESNILGAERAKQTIDKRPDQGQPQKFAGYTADELMHMRQQDPDKFKQVMKELHGGGKNEKATEEAAPAQGGAKNDDDNNGGGGRNKDNGNKGGGGRSKDKDR